jgi:predicted ATPase/DNA-binding SARP family transcriptional activator
MDNSLRISTLGGLQIQRDRELVTGLASRKAEALLVYLACTGRPHARENLATLLWDDRPQTRALGNLSVLLSSLRKHLSPYVIITRSSVEFNKDSDHWLDVNELASTILEMEEEPGSFTAQTTEKLENALAFYQSDFLDGFYIRGARGFEEWVIYERERIRLGVLDALSSLIKYHESSGNFQKGIHYARRVLELEPLMEVGHQQLMRLLDHSGRSSEALIQYENCRQILSDELGVEPSEETQELYTQLLKGESLPGGPRPQPQHNLPLPLPDLIGRDEDLIQIERLIKNTAYRLLTLIGVGGIGKTRLGLQTAASELDSFPDGVWLVQLAAIIDPEILPDHIAGTFGVTAQEARGRLGVTDILVDYLKDKNLLLVLDNCEHLIDACALFVEAVIKGCPQVKVLATSREAFGIPGEQIYQVPPLELPEDDVSLKDLPEYSAVRLFLERAASSFSLFGLTAANADVLTEICRQLDGIPLAIELAAARVKVISLNQIAERLKDRFYLLTGGPRTALPRHQTLQATMDWSYNLLSEPERCLWRRLPVFSGGWTLEAAEEVISFDGVTKREILDLTTQLVDKSLVNVDKRESLTRYGMLETVRQYGLIKLSEKDENYKARQQHANYFLHLAEQADEGLRDHRQIEALKIFDNEHDNLRSALRWSIQNSEADLAFRLVGALGWYWFMRGHWVEARRSLNKALEMRKNTSPMHLAKAIYRAGGLELIRGNLVDTVELVEEAKEICKEAGDIEGLAWCFNLLGQGRTWALEDFKVAGPLLSESIDHFRSLDNDWGVAWCLRYLGQVYEFQGEYKRGKEVLEESILLFDKIGDIWNSAHSVYLLGVSAFRNGDDQIAKRAYEKCLEKCGIVEDKVMDAHALRGLAQLALRMNDLIKAEVLFRNALKEFQKIGDDNCAGVALRDLAEVMKRNGNFHKSANLLRQSLRIYQRLGNEEEQVWIIERFGALALSMGFGERAARLLAVGKGYFSEGDTPVFPTYRDEHSKNVAAVRELLGDQPFEHFFSEGSEMSLQEAIDYAIAGKT